MKTIFFLALVCLMMNAQAQIDTTLLRRIQADTSPQKLNMDAIYNRPLLQAGKFPIALGGYVEADYQHLGTEGISEGHQFQFRRLTLFVASTIANRIKFLSELEFEPADKAISIEFAAIDLEFHPLFNLRGGMIVNPIGAFNQNHDGPKWEFTDRPIAAEQMLPATWSNVGFGLYGKYYRNKWLLGYELYLTGGFDNTIIENEYNRTYLPASKANAARFEESSNGEPLVTAKVAVKNTSIGELGMSYMGGIYNKYQQDGLRLDEKRRVSIVALDANTNLRRTGTVFTGEFAWIIVNVPSTYSQQFGRKQRGGFLDIVQPVMRSDVMGWRNSTLNLACRFEYVDYNVGRFKETRGKIGDDVWSIMPAFSFRPNAQTIFRLNYRIQKQRDLLTNPATNTAGFNFGLSTYF